MYIGKASTTTADCLYLLNRFKAPGEKVAVALFEGNGYNKKEETDLIRIRQGLAALGLDVP